MKYKLMIGIAVSAWLLSGCGNSTNDPSIQGQLVDSPVEGASYQCGTINSLTDRQGRFYCYQYPIAFRVAGIELGSIDQLPPDGYVTVQDLLRLSRDDFSNDSVANSAVLLQSLDDDGDIEQAVTLDRQKVENLGNVVDSRGDEYRNIANITPDDLVNLLQEAGVTAVTPQDALNHLQNHMPQAGNGGSGNGGSGNGGSGNGGSGNGGSGNGGSGNGGSGNGGSGNGGSGNGGQLDSATIQAYLEAINQARRQGRNCGSYGYQDAAPDLSWNDHLYSAALEHSRDMALSNTFSHTGSGTNNDVTAKKLNLSNGSRPSQRVTANGYDWRATGENIAAGTAMDQASEAMALWLNSPGHCKNIMNPSYEEVGMAVYFNSDSYYKYYWTQNFGTGK